MSEDSTEAKKVALLRMSLALSLVVELLGYFFITFGFALHRPIWFFLFGIITKMGGSLLGAFFQNKAGIILSLELQTYLKRLSMHALEIKSFLSERGCSESEINSLRTLPSDVYQSELNGYQRALILNIGAPIFCGFALLANGDYVISLIVIVIGLLSFPIGERFFKENTFRRESELRLGIAAQVSEYIDKVYKGHVWLTTKVNFLSQLPLLIFTFRYIWNGSGQLLASFFGLTQGLAGLTGTLAFQKARAAAIRTTETTTHLIHALSSPYLIVTPQRWQEHCSRHGRKEIIPRIKHDTGVLLDDFSPAIPFHKNKMFSVSCFIPSGTICILRAPSGQGKSTFLAAITHLIEHTGDIFFFSSQKQTNVHELSQEAFQNQLFYFREENVDNSARLIDLFKDITRVDMQQLLRQSQSLFSQVLIDLAWKAPDNLLEQEIKNIEMNKQSVFPTLMLSFLKELRESQSAIVQTFLTKAQGNLASHRIFPERNFFTLSSGEQRRIVALLALETCKTREVRFVILDEPFTHLDPTNQMHQIDTIKQLQELPAAPSILLISHQFIEETKKHLNCVEELRL